MLAVKSGNNVECEQESGEFRTVNKLIYEINTQNMNEKIKKDNGIDEWVGKKWYRGK